MASSTANEPKFQRNARAAAAADTRLPRWRRAAVAEEQDQEDSEDNRAGRMSNDVDENRLVEIGHAATSSADPVERAPQKKGLKGRRANAVEFDAAAKSTANSESVPPIDTVSFPTTPTIRVQPKAARTKVHTVNPPPGIGAITSTAPSNRRASIGVGNKPTNHAQSDGKPAAATDKSIDRQNVALPRSPKPRAIEEPSRFHPDWQHSNHAPQERNKIKLSSKSPAANEVRATAQHSTTERHARETQRGNRCLRRICWPSISPNDSEPGYNTSSPRLASCFNERLEFMVSGIEAWMNGFPEGGSRVVSAAPYADRPALSLMLSRTQVSIYI